MEENPVVERKNRHHVAGIAVIAFALYFSAMQTRSMNEFAVVIMLPFLVAVSSHLLWRFCLLLEELFHVERLVMGSYVDVLKRSLSCNKQSLSVLIMLIVALLACFPNGSGMESITKTYQELGPIPFCATMCAFYILCLITRAEQCETWEAHTMRHIHGLDYGAGMAHSFFHGYLKLILPSTGHNTPSIRDRIVKFMGKENLDDSCFPVKKLVVLIPSSGYSFPKLSSSDKSTQAETNPDIEPVEKLQDHLRDRAGTVQRVYRGGAYRIRMHTGVNKFMYILAEGATAVLTFQEACKSGTEVAELLKRHRVDIISIFYQTLKNLIQENIDCRDLVDLIYYDDTANTNVVPLLRDYLLRNQ